ncbi:hypothetical protein Y032_0040g232 [Ancylostoma ceylanicum]|uniref:DUF19 domain-containing protein n=1 Tax=Ancylostoma ceylanicum TaxID=53326 RepID=A0A016UI28_9BILA|nr:hypothetical protein Y032_0040g232 [Ancylostoma ceylanicum]
MQYTYLLLLVIHFIGFRCSADEPSNSTATPKNDGNTTPGTSDRVRQEVTVGQKHNTPPNEQSVPTVHELISLQDHVVAKLSQPWNKFVCAKVHNETCKVSESIQICNSGKDYVVVMGLLLKFNDDMKDERNLIFTWIRNCNASLEETRAAVDALGKVVSKVEPVNIPDSMANMMSVFTWIFPLLFMLLPT